MIQNLNFNLFDQINDVNVDKFGRVTAFLGVHKPKGITSHDLVNQVRRKLQTRTVGHVGALDPAASGIMLILVGKKFTQMSNELMNLGKAYRTRIVFGLSTDSLDLEGKVTESSDLSDFSFEKIKTAISQFEGGYDQYVPVFSSVKVEGNKLRVLARSSQSFKIFEDNGIKKIEFEKVNNKKNIVIDQPHKKVEISNIKFISEGYMNISELDLKIQETEIDHRVVPYIDIEFDCSKGTYVRQFAYDLACKINQVGMLVDLERTKIGPITKNQVIAIDDVVLR